MESAGAYVGIEPETLRERSGPDQDSDMRVWSVKGFVGTLQNLAQQAADAAAGAERAKDDADARRMLDTLYKVLCTDLETALGML